MIASVVDQDIDLAEAIDDLPNRRVNLLCIQQIALNRQNRAAAPGEVRFCAPEFLSIARNERDLSTAAQICRASTSPSPRDPPVMRTTYRVRSSAPCGLAQNQPCDEDNGGYAQKNPNIHFSNLQSGTGDFAASLPRRQARSL